MKGVILVGIFHPFLVHDLSKKGKKKRRDISSERSVTLFN
jgi:hypothetical protein